MGEFVRRIYDEAVAEHYRKDELMLFLAGARQVGKTTTGLKVARELYYFNWDDEEDRLLVAGGPRAILDAVDLEKGRTEKPLLIFDELHKRADWKRFLKGFFDKYHYQVDIMVTGSARLDVYQRGGDSLMGRYFLYRVHPFSVGELLDPKLRKELVRQPRQLDEEAWDALYRFGGFPAPLFAADDQFLSRWARLRRQQLFREDLRDLSRVQEISQMELLAEWLRRQVGSRTTLESLAGHVGVSFDTIRRWLGILQSLYYIYAVHPWAGQVPNSLTKQPKYFLWDWSQIEDPGARAENLIASHLLKACHFWTDDGLGEFGLYYLRDRRQRELDFCVVKDGKPWILVEVKRSRNHGISGSTHYFAEVTGAPHVLQVVLDMPFESYDCFAFDRPTIVSARTFLSQLI